VLVLMTRQIWGKEEIVQLIVAYDRLIYLLAGPLKTPVNDAERRAWEDIKNILGDMGFYDE
jgi:hypothetical protein